MTDYSVNASHISKAYQVDKRMITVLNDVNISVNPGQFIVLEGTSGSGKSTLLSILSGLDKPDSGRIILAGTDITDFKEDALAPFRNSTIGFVFQSYHLIPSLTAVENVMFPAQLKKTPHATEKANELLDRVELSERKNNFPHQLSGGEKQRIAICRALINNPKILFADEPTGNLDSTNGKLILKLLFKLRLEFGSTLILATHSPEISQAADDVIHLKDGVIGNSITSSRNK